MRSSLTNAVVTATRWRLALWYSLVTAVLLLVFASGVYWYVRDTLVDRVDDTLNHVAEVLQGSLLRQPTMLAEPPLRLDPGMIDEDHIDLEWFDAQGHLIWSTLTTPLGIPVQEHLLAETVDLASGTSVRQITRPLSLDQHLLGYVRVSHPWFEVTKPTRQLAWDLSLGTMGMVAAVGSVGWLLSGLAMAPMRDSYQRLKQFTADASHELRSPIASMQTQVQAVLQDPALDAEDQRLWQGIERQSQRLGQLVEDLLFLARQDNGVLPSKQCCPVDAVLIAAIEEQQPLATQRGLTLRFDIGDGDPLFNVDGDYNQLLRLFTNLIANAIQYTPEGGEVHVYLEHHAKGLQIQVRDTGIGIPESALPHVFDRFYRVDPARRHAGGSGLGLAIAQSIVRQHQGDIRVQSLPNQGTTFTVSLPSSRDPQCRLDE
ncbi:MAG: HAMP domain-containing sensor histidine kinase [Synechococcales cyanobacterium]